MANTIYNIARAFSFGAFWRENEVLQMHHDRTLKRYMKKRMLLQLDFPILSITIASFSKKTQIYTSQSSSLILVLFESDK